MGGSRCERRAGSSLDRCSRPRRAPLPGRPAALAERRHDTALGSMQPARQRPWQQHGLTPLQGRPGMPSSAMQLKQRSTLLQHSPVNHSAVDVDLPSSMKQWRASRWLRSSGSPCSSPCGAVAWRRDDDGAAACAVRDALQPANDSRSGAFQQGFVDWAGGAPATAPATVRHYFISVAARPRPEKPMQDCTEHVLSDRRG